MSFSISPSEFYDNDDAIGLFSYDPEPFEFFSINAIND